ncbi:MAG TPA: hypothetical protein VHR72_07260 [Gemmataceae bacterium]|jgi:uncharacterized coiled-coil protein SlyX|nr:hypothetical protein [Gemmataceae bacterium]
MRSPRRIGLGLGIVVVPLLGSLGCTFSITPNWHMPSAMPPVASPYPINPPIPGSALPNPAGLPPTGLPPGAPPLPPGTVLPPVSARSPSDYVSQLAERLQGSEDSRQALANRVQVLEMSLRDKDQAVLQTSHEVQESTKQMRRTREDLQRLKQELDDSRAKNLATYREYKNTLDAFLKALEDNVEPGRSPLKFRPTSQIGEPPGQ